MWHMQVARTAASAVAFAQTCFGSSSGPAQAVALKMAPVDDDKLLRFFDVCPKYAVSKESVEAQLVPSHPVCPIHQRTLARRHV